MRLVLDANVVASGIFWSGPPSEILKRWLRGKEALLVSVPILAEYHEVLSRLAGGPQSPLFAKWSLLLAEFSEMVEPERLGRLCRDSDDDKYLEAAVGGGAQALISGDRDLLVLNEVRGIPILSPRRFLGVERQLRGT